MTPLPTPEQYRAMAADMRDRARWHRQRADVAFEQGLPHTDPRFDYFVQVGSAERAAADKADEVARLLLSFAQEVAELEAAS